MKDGIPCNIAASNLTKAQSAPQKETKTAKLKNRRKSFGSTFEECLDKLEKTPLYIGYGGNRDFILPLKEKKALRGGWADFEFSSENPVDHVGDMNDYVSDRFNDLLDR